MSPRVLMKPWNIDGTILTKLDGDTRGGAALSVRAVTGKPTNLMGFPATAEPTGRSPASRHPAW